MQPRSSRHPILLLTRLNSDSTNQFYLYNKFDINLNGVLNRDDITSSSDQGDGRVPLDDREVTLNVFDEDFGANQFGLKFEVDRAGN